MKNRIFAVVVTLSALLSLGADGCGEAPPSPAAPSTPDIVSTDAGPLRVVPIEHATFVMVWNGRTIVVDPVGGAEAFAGHQKPDLILITDTHGDHLSVPTVEAIAGPFTTVVAPAAAVEAFPEPAAAADSPVPVDRSRILALANDEVFEWVREYLPEDGESFSIDLGTVEAVPMYNLSEDRKDFHVKGRGNGYLLTLGGARIYISGDTEDIPEMRALEDIDAAFVCMNLPYTMDVAAAADAVLDFKPRIVFPYHFRGKNGFSDTGEFTRLVAANPEIEVRVLDWY